MSVFLWGLIFEGGGLYQYILDYLMCVFYMCMYYRSRDYDSLVELGARIGIKIRERDGSTGSNSKVCAL